MKSECYAVFDKPNGAWAWRATYEHRGMAEGAAGDCGGRMVAVPHTIGSSDADMFIDLALTDLRGTTAREPDWSDYGNA